MPPKPLAEDLARKKAERDKAKLGYATPKKDDGGGWGWFGDLVANPIDTIKGVGQAAKSNLYDPSKRFAAAVDPGSGASVADRIAGVGEGLLYAADFLTPGVPEGAMARGGSRIVNVGLNAPKASPVMSPSGVAFPRNVKTVQYEQAMKRLAERYGNRTMVPSIQVQGSQMRKILDAGAYDPTLAADAGHIGMVNRVDAAVDPEAAAAAERYAAVREQIHQRTGGPVYGHLRNPLDVSTASSYRQAKGKAGFGNTLDPEDMQKFWDDYSVQGIIDFTPRAGTTVAPGNSFHLYQAARNQGNVGGFEKMLMPYEDTLPSIVTDAPTPQVYVDALDAGIPGMGSSYKPPYAEVQTQPVDVADMQRLTVIRDQEGLTPQYYGRSSVVGGTVRRPNAMQVLARNRALAERARAAGLDVVTGTSTYGTKMLTPRQMDEFRSKPGFMDMLTEQFFIPDRVALDQIPVEQYRAQLRQMAKIVAEQRRAELARRAADAAPAGEMFLANDF